MKKKSRVTNRYNYVPVKMEKDPAAQVSVTMPDQHMNIREIMERFTIGNAPPLAKEEFYDDGDHDSFDMEKVTKMDILDRDQVKAFLYENMEQQKKDLEELRQKQSKAQEDLQKKFTEWLNKEQKDPEGHPPVD